MKENNELTTAQEDYRRGRTEYHKNRAIVAKKILLHIKANPGATKDQILTAIGETSGKGGFELLREHRLAMHQGSPARWFATGWNPRA